MPATVIKNADWALPQAQPGRHVYMRNVDVAFDGNTITHVGKDYVGAADTVVDGRKRMVMPGLVNLHSHPEHEPAYRGVREEHGLPNMYMSGLFERSQAFYATDDEFRAASASSPIASCCRAASRRWWTSRRRGMVGPTCSPRAACGPFLLPATRRHAGSSRTTSS